MLAWGRVCCQAHLVVGGIHFLVSVGLRVLFSCWPGAPSSTGRCPQFPAHEIPQHGYCMVKKRENRADTAVFS